MNKFFPLSIFKVVGNSMSPMYKNGERVVVQRWFVFPAVSDVVILKDPRNGRLILKRVVRVKSHSHKVENQKRNGLLIGLRMTIGRVRFFACAQNDKEEYFVEGDNKKESTDSRQFGWVKRNQIFGRVIWPYNRLLYC